MMSYIAAPLDFHEKLNIPVPRRVWRLYFYVDIKKTEEGKRDNVRLVKARSWWV